MTEAVTQKLFSLKDNDYKNFHSALMPTVNKEKIIGVRAPLLRSFAKELYGTKEGELFISSLPHYHYEENNLHAFIISLYKNYDECIKKLDVFLPYVDNWATCDGLNPKILKKEPEKLLIKIKEWLKSERTYTVRFAVKCLMDYYLEENFNDEILMLVASVKSNEYYINMGCAWFFATALAKRPEDTLPYITERKLEVRVHNKTIQKAIESRRTDEAIKQTLKKYIVKHTEKPL